MAAGILDNAGGGTGTFFRSDKNHAAGALGRTGKHPAGPSAVTGSTFGNKTLPTYSMDFGWLQ